MTLSSAESSRKNILRVGQDHVHLILPQEHFSTIKSRQNFLLLL